MALSDAVTDQIATNTDFQPAVGVEVCITTMRSSNTTPMEVTDGTTSKPIEASTSDWVSSLTIKLFITNDDYITCPSGPNGYYTGVQTAT